MAKRQACDRTEILNSTCVNRASSSRTYSSGENSINVEEFGSSSENCVIPCYFLLQFLGMWKASDGGDSPVHVVSQIYNVLVLLLWLTSLVAVMSLDFIHYGFKKNCVHYVDILNSVPTCLNLLCPFVFTKLYFKHGQFTQLVSTVQNTSAHYRARLRKSARFYTWLSVSFWHLSATFFTFHWTPFFSHTWQYIVYETVIIYTTGWWAVWLSIYAFVCHIHTLQIEALRDAIRSKDSTPVFLIRKHQELRHSLERTQRDFNFIISFSLSYHALDIIIFSFAYFDLAFGKNYPLWQYAGGVSFDLITILIKLFPPAVLAAAVRRTVIEAGKRCDVTPLATSMPHEDLMIFEYMSNCERDVGLKILGIRITIELAGTILMTIITACASFVAFVVPRLK